MTGLTEDVPALGFRDQPFEDFFGLFIDLQDALPCPPLQSALDRQVSPVAIFIGPLISYAKESGADPQSDPSLHETVHLAY